MTFKQECQALENLSVFRGVDPSRLKLLAFASQRVSLDPGQALITNGDPPDAAYIILEGEVDVVRESGPARVQLARLGRGMIVGEMSVLSGRNSSATVAAVTPLIALRIERHVFLQLLEDVPQIAMAVARELGRRLEAMNDRIAAETVG